MIRLAAVLSLFVLTTACTSEAGASGNPAGIAGEIQKTLASVTDPQTAEKAKEQLTSLTDQFSKALEAAKSAASGVAKDMADQGGDLAGKAGEMAGKAAEWVSPEMKNAFSSVRTEIERLMGNPEIQKVLGDTLTKLKGLLPSAG